MYSSISKHIVCLNHCVFDDIYDSFKLLVHVRIANIYVRVGFRLHKFECVRDHQQLAFTPNGRPRRITTKKWVSKVFMDWNIESSIKLFENQTYSRDTSSLCWSIVIIIIMCSNVFVNQKSMSPGRSMDSHSCPLCEHAQLCSVAVSCWHGRWGLRDHWQCMHGARGRILDGQSMVTIL